MDNIKCTSCGNPINRGAKFCKSCGHKVAVSNAARSAATWLCSNCGTMNMSHNATCIECSCPKPGSTPTHEKPPQINTWICPNCQKVNVYYATNCAKCNRKKSYIPAPKTARIYQDPPGSWHRITKFLLVVSIIMNILSTIGWLTGDCLRIFYKFDEWDVDWIMKNEELSIYPFIVGFIPSFAASIHAFYATSLFYNFSERALKHLLAVVSWCVTPLMLPGTSFIMLLYSGEYADEETRNTFLRTFDFSLPMLLLLVAIVVNTIVHIVCKDNEEYFKC